MTYTRYTHALDIMYENLDAFISEDKWKHKKIVIFGTSKVASMMIHYLTVNRRPPYAIIDNSQNRQNQIIYGLSVYKPEHLLLPFQDDYVILIASGHQEEMRKQLENMGYVMNIHIFYALDFLSVLEDYSFVDRSGYTEMSEEDLKKEQLSVLKYLKKICEANNIQYYLAYGTLLGAVRHKGYIPWDDDIDVYVYEKDIPKLCSLLQDDKDFGIISSVNGCDYYDEYHLMVSHHSILDTNHFPIQLSTGVSIDIFPLCAIPGEPDEFARYCREIKNLEMEKWNKLYSKSECLKAANKLHDFMVQYPPEECTNVGCLLSFAYTRDVYPKEYFQPAQLIFEGELFSVPENYDAVLTKLYGDYMTPPPPEKRLGHHFFRAYYKQ